MAKNQEIRDAAEAGPAIPPQAQRQAEENRARTYAAIAGAQATEIAKQHRYEPAEVRELLEIYLRFYTKPGAWGSDID